MKILLLGEFSGLHKNLKDGLVELGHDVTIASGGDGWKGIEGDINLGTSKKGIIRIFEKIYNILKAVPKFKNYDIVQFISPVVFPKLLGINDFIVNYILKKNNKIFLSGAGAIPQNTVLADFCEHTYKYPQLYNEYKGTNPEMWSQSKRGREYNQWLFEQINGYIPISYLYAQGFRDIKYEKLCPTISIPMNIDEIKYADNIVSEKLIIFHGLNREGIKGTPLIRQAMEKLQKDYPDKVECVLDGKLPLEKYLQLLRRVNIVVDQVYSSSVGVNGVYSMAMGKIVVGGGEPEFLKELGIKNSPIVSIQPDVSDIYNKLETLVKNQDKILDMGRSSRKFAETVHDYKKIAQQYVDVWGH